MSMRHSYLAGNSKIEVEEWDSTPTYIIVLLRTYLIFVIFFTWAKFLENKIYTEKRQFFALNL